MGVDGDCFDVRGLREKGRWMGGGEVCSVMSQGLPESVVEVSPGS